ncbi:MAG TPA: hypothetical protein VJN43_16185 [Bryobacteraceae bacterium]|nr:hypothetical protein [Bryobacteraceae bacterium]
MRWMLALLLLPLFAAEQQPQVFYSKSFPGSAPPYVEIHLDRAGNCEYKEAPDDDQPLKFQLNAPDTNEIFSLVDKLGRFSRPLESPLKVAFMGTKTYRFENGAEKHEVKFNFSEDLDARQLQDWFERIAETEQRLIYLEREAKYDKLGVNNALLLLQSSFDHKRLVAPQQFLPMLDRVVKNESYMHMARERAAGLADAIRAAK